MGLFDKVFGGNQPQKMTPQEAFTGVIMSAVASDGAITQEEAMSIIAILSRMKLYQGMNDGQIRKMLDKTVDTLKLGRPVEGHAWVYAQLASSPMLYAVDAQVLESLPRGAGDI